MSAIENWTRMSFSVCISKMGIIFIVPSAYTGKLSPGQEQIPMTENAGSCGGQQCCLPSLNSSAILLYPQMFSLILSISQVTICINSPHAQEAASFLKTASC